jgi:hypothetical protein
MSSSKVKFRATTGSGIYRNIKSIIGYLKLSSKYDLKNYYSWHRYSMVNFKFFDYPTSSERKANTQAISTPMRPMR